MRAALLALAACLAALLALPAGAGAVTVGIADQKPSVFADPLFRDLDVRHARLVVPWDVLADPYQVQGLDQWLQAARDAGVTPLLTFGHSRREGHRKDKPTTTRLRREFLRLRARYPWITDWAAWNEPNHCSQPLCNRPELAARYYDTIRRACRECRVLAAEVLDMPNMGSWVRRFRRAAKVEPKYWGMHNYVDANRFRTKGTRELLRATKGEIWLTETGGIVKRRTRVKVTLPESTGHAADATRWLFDRLVPLSKRITRVYLYHWSPSTRRDTWDSALVNINGRPREALRVLRSRITRIRAAEARRETERRAGAPASPAPVAAPAPEPAPAAEPAPAPAVEAAPAPAPAAP
jgi:hypothetical protein